MPELLLLLSGTLWIAALLEPVHAKHVGIYPTARWPCLLTSHRVDCPFYPSYRADCSMGRTSAVCVPCPCIASNRVELSLYCGHPDSSEHLCWWFASDLSRAWSCHSRLHLLYDDRSDERCPDCFVGTGLWNAWDGAQYRDSLWRRCA